ncbi:MAG: hypothetical protein K0R25_100 [Rickettsiaceae bacterium]|jgi:prepilin-type N-terminal cleavage/methylation domain-containing protein|nr:hypothetical protein [Rickettsiaceae bacterium]
MKKQSNKKMGFSLIELSVVILVIGILVIGITKGTSIISKARITSARSATNSSPAATTPDMVAWYEASLASSFNTTTLNGGDGTALSTSNSAIAWIDNSPLKGNNASTPSSGTPSAKYQENIINGLPAVRFNGAATAVLSFNGSALARADYTVFVVEQREAETSTSGRFLGFGSNAIGYSSNLAITMPAGSSSTTSQAVTAFVKVTPRILTFVSSGTLLPSVTKGVFINGGAGSVAANGTVDSALTNTSTSTIGSAGSNYYTGSIAEIIIYSRTLTLTERNEIQDYLSKKYAIRTTISS